MLNRTPLTRRSFLSAGAVATAATVVGGRSWAAPAAAAAAAAGGHLRRSSYLDLTGQTFSTGSVDLRLLSVSDVAGAAGDPSLAGSEDAFALAFSGPLGTELESGTHTLRHADLGTFELFVAPVERPRADRRYQAVVDRSVGAPKSPPKPPPAPAAAPAAAAATATAEPALRHAAPRGARLLRRAAVRRKGRGARAEVVLRPAARFERVHGRLVRRGKTFAVASREVRDQRALLRFRREEGLPAGSYTMVLTLVDAAGLTAIRRRRVTLD